MARKFKIIVPKAGASNEFGTDTKLYIYNENVEAKESWQEDLMNVFVKNGWAMEIKDDELSEVEVAEPVRARNERGQLVGDDPSTPDVNEAWEGGKAPVKRGRSKKSTKKKS
jgi:hypothetical protein